MKVNFADYLIQITYLFYNNLMKRQLRTGNSLGVGQEDMTQALGSLRNLFSENELNNDQGYDLEKEKLNGIILKTKKEKLRDIFIQKLKRVLPTDKHLQVNNKREYKNLHKIQVRAVDLPDVVIHIVLFVNLIVMLVLMWVTTLEQFNKNLLSDIDYSLVQAFKILCLALNSASFFLKVISRSFRSQINQIYIRDVIKAYARQGRLFIDLIMIIFQILTLALSRTMLVSALFSLFLIFSMFYIVPDLIKIQTAYLRSEKSVLIWGLVKVCFANLILAHIMAGILLAMTWFNQEYNWLIRADIYSELWYVKYFYALYWGTTIMMTVGFGDILPANLGEVIVTTFLEMFSCIVLGYNVSQIGHLISQLREKDELVNRKLAIFDRMVKSRPISHQKDKEEQNRMVLLYKSIYSHIQQLNSTETNLQYQRRNQFLQELPEHLRKAYYHLNNRKIFSHTLFFNQLKRTSMERMAQIFESKLYYAGEIMLENKQRIMILESGEVGLAYKKRGSTLNGKMFDVVKVEKTEKPTLMTNSFLNISNELNYYFGAKIRSVVWSIHLDDFLESLGESQIDFQYYFNLYHKHVINEDEWSSVECPRCTSKYMKSCHFVYDCPKITYKPLKGVIIMKYASHGDSKLCQRRRTNWKRSQYVKISAMKYQKNFKQVSEKLRIDNKRFTSVTQNELDTKANFHNQHWQPQALALPHRLPVEVRNQILELIQVGMHKYQTGFEEGFWDLEIDLAHNYQFYFPKDNASRLLQTNVVKYDIKITKTFKDFMMRKFIDQVDIQ